MSNRKPRHMYYHDPGKLDLSKMRADAYRSSVGDAISPPVDVTIHFHEHGMKCDGKQHEEFKAQKEDND